MALLRRLSTIIFFMSLIGCGGGDGGLDGSDQTEAPISISLAFKSGDTVSSSTPLTVIATVTQGEQAVSNKLVTYTISDSELAVFASSNGAQTNTEGVAEITLEVGAKEGDGSITASIDSGDVTSSSLSFKSTGDGNGAGAAKVEAVSLFASSQQIASSGAKNINLTAIIKDENNNLIEGARVTFSSTSGSIQHDGKLTGPDGKANAILSTQAEPENRLIEVTAASGLISDKVNVQVVGTTVTLTGSSSLAINDENTFIINVLDSDGNAISDEKVSLTLTNQASGNVASITIPSEVTTDSTGQATVAVVGTSGGTNSIVATALGFSITRDISVQADSFLFTKFNNGNGTILNPSLTPNVADVLLSDSATITLTWLRNGSPVSDGTIVNFTTTRGTLVNSSATTVNGEVNAVINSADAGDSLITFSGIDGAINLENQIQFEFVAETASTIVAQAYPKSIGPNGETSTISVIVKDVNGNLVKNKTIDFSLSDTSGGAIFPSSAVTDSSGQASTIYKSNAVSAQNGISIKAEVKGNIAVNDTVFLTVSERELFIALGTGNSLIAVDDTTYNKQYSVFVTDVNSNPVKDVVLTVSATPKTYDKGVWGVVLKDGEFDHYAPNPSITCPNEDGSNGGDIDGILDSGEDVNNDGKLTPGNLVAALNQVTTNELGRAVIDIEYAEVFGGWADINLIVSTKVEGTENFAQAIFSLPVLASDVNVEGNPPASFVWPNSPFGASNSCSNPN